jgi:hypothetical protein
MKRVRADDLETELRSPSYPRRMGSTSCVPPQERFLSPPVRSPWVDLAGKDDALSCADAAALPMMPDDFDFPIETSHGAIALPWIHRACNVLDSPVDNYIPVRNFAAVGSTSFYDTTTTTHGTDIVALPLLPCVVDLRISPSSSCGSQRLSLRSSSAFCCVRG